MDLLVLFNQIFVQNDEQKQLNSCKNVLLYLATVNLHSTQWQVILALSSF